MKNERLLLSAGDMAAVTGLTVAKVDDWCRRGVLSPVSGGAGQGNHRGFSLMQALGLMVALEVQRSPRSCVLGYIRTVVAAFATMDEPTLTERFATDGTHFVLVHDGRPILQGPDLPGLYPDVAKLYTSLLKKVHKLSREPRNPVGRNRGLVTS